MIKKILLFSILIFSAFALNAQQLTDSYDAVSESRTGFSYTITVRIQKTADGNYSATLLKAVPDSKGYYDQYSDKLYSCSQLGNVCNPNDFGRIGVTVRSVCNGEERAAGPISFTRINETITLGLAVTQCTYDKSLPVTGFSMEMTGATQSVSNTTAIANRIKELEKGSADTNKSQNNPSNPAAQTTTPAGNDATNYNPTNYTPTPTKTDVYVQTAATVVGSLVDEMNANYERKEAQYKADLQAGFAREDQKREAKFRTEFLPLMKQAEKGDENARMALYLGSEDLEQPLPQKEQWLEEAIANNNLDALLIQARFKCFRPNAPKDCNFISIIPYLELAAGLGSVDAMMILAQFYDINNVIAGSGNDSNKAFEWFQRAAYAGSPNAMYYLGMIYKYAQTTDDKYEKRIHVQHNIGLDEKVALEWFIKAEQPNYKESLFARSHLFYDRCSYYEPDTYYQTFLLYKKGKVVKDKAKAAEMQKAIKFEYGVKRDEVLEYKKANEKFIDISRY